MARERLQKVLAAAGVASRRRAEELIARGDVVVNGRVAELGQTVDPLTDRIVVNGTLLTTAPKRIYLALNKPAGYVSSLRGYGGEPTVTDLIKLPQRVFPVGRLDKDTTGLLLLTNDGEWANLVTHPRYGVEKQYEVLVSGHPSSSTLRRLAEGVELPDRTRTAPATVRRILDRRDSTLFSLTVVEGKRRQIRQMCSAVGHPVIELRRMRVGPIRLDKLGVGAWRYLQPDEVEGMREHAGRRSEQSRV